MKKKAGVKLAGVQWQMFEAALKVEPILEKHGQECVITSGTEGQHSALSLHYRGWALDFRTTLLPKLHYNLILAELKAALGGDFDVVFESDHLHIEYDPK